MTSSRPTLALALLLALRATPARAGDPLADDAILGPDRQQGARLESLRVRFTHYDQDGSGYQSQAGPTTLGPGSQWMTVEQPQIEAIIRHNDRLKTRLWLPLDIITAASPDAIDKHRPLDAMSSASRTNESGSIDFATTYQADPRTSTFVRAGFHLEENFRSYNLGAGITRSFAEDNTVLSASINQVVDWFDAYLIDGTRQGHVWRSSSNVNLGVTQLLSPTTVAALNYGFTYQDRHLGVTWNSVPLDDGTPEGQRGPEVLPEQRFRHAVVGRLAQALPWNGALKVSYRFYGDSWGVSAHSAEAQLYQRLSPWLYLRGNYRIHQQSGVYFFTTRAPVGGRGFRSADSDLAGFFAHTVGGRAVFDFRAARRLLRGAELNLGYEYYVRTNDLRVHILSCGLAFTF